MAQKTTILLVRHGFSLSNAMRTFTGQTDIELSETGYKQAEKVCEFVLGNYKVDEIYSSDLVRAVDTVKGIADHLKKPVRKEKAFREIYGGEWEGKTPEEIERDHEEDYRAWKEDMSNTRCTGGENGIELMERSYSRLQEIVAKEKGKTIVIATHAGVIRALECKIRGLADDEMQKVPWVTNASVTEIVYENGKFREEKVSQDHYLDGIITELKAF